MALTILEDVPTSQLVRVRDDHDFEFYTLRTKLQHVGGGEYALVSQQRAKNLRAQYARKAEIRRISDDWPEQDFENVHQRRKIIVPTLTAAQHRKVHRLLEPRALDAAKNIFRVSLGLDPDQVSDAAMMEMCHEIGKVFYPILGRFVSGEPMDAPIFAPAPPEVVDAANERSRQQVKNDLQDVLTGVLCLPDVPQRVIEAAERLKVWTE